MHSRQRQRTVPDGAPVRERALCGMVALQEALVMKLTIDKVEQTNHSYDRRYRHS